MNSSKVAKNPAGHEERLFENIVINLARSRIYSPLIDVLHVEPYNIRMEENTVQTLVAFEIVQPAKKLDRSAGALLFALIALVLAIIFAANVVSFSLNIPRELVQLPLYALLTASCYYAYRRHYVCYRYTLTDQTFAVDRISGTKEHALAAILLTDIESVRPPDAIRDKASRVLYASVRNRKQSYRMNAMLDGQMTRLSISISEEFYLALLAQMQTIAKREST